MDINKLLNYLHVEQIDKYVFVGQSPARPSRIFGGQVLAQCLNAASRTVGEDRLAHSLHAYFLRPGDPSVPILYQVDGAFRNLYLSNLISNGFDFLVEIIEGVGRCVLSVQRGCASP